MVARVFFPKFHDARGCSGSFHARRTLPHTVGFSTHKKPLTPYYSTDPKMGGVVMTIGKLAQAAGVGVETIRFYERKGIIKRPSRLEGGFRRYSSEDVARVRFVKRAQELGFTLREVKELLEIQSKRKMTGAQVRATAKAKIQEIQQKISDLKSMEGSLKELCRVCGEGEQAIRECKIFDCFGKSCS